MSAFNAIAGAPLEMRQRWYAEMNCWRNPADFPVALPSIEDRQKYENPEWRAAWDALHASLSEEERSFAWWIHHLGQTEEEWRRWWKEHGGAA